MNKSLKLKSLNGEKGFSKQNSLLYKVSLYIVLDSCLAIWINVRSLQKFMNQVQQPKMSQTEVDVTTDHIIVLGSVKLLDKRSSLNFVS